jgi:hypothetical protein
MKARRVHDGTLVLDSSEGVLALTLVNTDGNSMRHMAHYFIMMGSNRPSESLLLIICSYVQLTPSYI